jgi:hypothetical protein
MEELEGGEDAPVDQDDGFDLSVEDDGHWYMGRAREEFNRRRRGADATDDGDDPVLVRLLLHPLAESVT